MIILAIIIEIDILLASFEIIKKVMYNLYINIFNLNKFKELNHFFIYGNFTKSR